MAGSDLKLDPFRRAPQASYLQISPQGGGCATILTFGTHSVGKHFGGGCSHQVTRTGGGGGTSAQRGGVGRMRNQFTHGGSSLKTGATGGGSVKTRIGGGGATQQNAGCFCSILKSLTTRRLSDCGRIMRSWLARRSLRPTRRCAPRKFQRSPVDQSRGNSCWLKFSSPPQARGEALLRLGVRAPIVSHPKFARMCFLPGNGKAHRR